MGLGGVASPGDRPTSVRLVPLRLRPGGRVRRCLPRGDARHRARPAHRRRHPRHPGLRRARRRARARARGPVPARGRRARGRRSGRRHRAALRRGRGRERRARRPRQRAARARGRDARRAAPGRRDHGGRVPAARAGPDLRRPRRDGARGRAPRGRRARSARSVPRSIRCSLTPALVPLPSDDGDGRITGEVLWVDHYGNCQLNIAPEQLEAAGAQRRRPARGHRRPTPRACEPAAGPAGCTRSPTPSRRSSSCSSTPTACARSRSTVDRRRPSSACAPAARSRSSTEAAGRAEPAPASRSGSGARRPARESGHEPGARGAARALILLASIVQFALHGCKERGRCRERRAAHREASSGSGRSADALGRAGRLRCVTAREDPERPHAHTRDRNPRSRAVRSCDRRGWFPNPRRPCGPHSLTGSNNDTAPRDP